MDQVQRIRFTPENRDRFELILNYLNSDRYPINGSISNNKALNLCVETFYNLFVETDPNVASKTFNSLINDYQRVRDNSESLVLQKLNRLDRLVSSDKYIAMQIFKNMVLSPDDKILKINSIYARDTFENKFEHVLMNQIQQDRNLNFNLKNKNGRQSK